MLLDLSLRQVIRNWRGPKVTIAAAGCGASLAGILNIPGCSKFLDGLYFPYGFGHVERNCAGWVDNYFSAECAAKLADNLYNKYCTRRAASDLDQEIFIGISAALITDRYRKGDEGFYLNAICEGSRYIIQPCGEIWPHRTEESYRHMNLYDIIERRIYQDRLITDKVMHLLNNYVSINSKSI